MNRSSPATNINQNAGLFQNVAEAMQALEPRLQKTESSLHRENAVLQAELADLQAELDRGLQAVRVDFSRQLKDLEALLTQKFRDDSKGKVDLSCAKDLVRREELEQVRQDWTVALEE